jgi:hypothetical protein
MGKPFSIGWFALVLVLGVCAGPARGDVYKFTYTSNANGVVGFFTVDADVFAAHLGEVGTPDPSFLDNVYIDELNFTFGATTWTTVDKAAGEYTSFNTSGPLPVVVGGSGALASTAANSDILLFSSTTRFGDTFVAGAWSTSVVPEPAAIGVLAAAAVLLPRRRRR